MPNMLISWKTMRQFQFLYRPKKCNYECDKTKYNGGKIAHKSREMCEKPEVGTIGTSHIGTRWEATQLLHMNQ